MKIIKDIVLFFYWYPFRLLISVLPLNVVYLMGLCAGNFFYLISGRKKSLIASEFSLVFPDYTQEQLQKIARKSFINFCLSEIEILLYPRFSKDNINKHVEIQGRHHLDDALSQGKGVLLLQAHLGAFQMVMPAIGFNGYTMNQISALSETWKISDLSWIQRKGYEIKSNNEKKLPIKHLAVGSSLRPVFTALKNNEIVGVTSDGGGGKRLVVVDFLGRKAHFQEGVASIAGQTSAVIVPTFITTGKWLTHRLTFHQPMRVTCYVKGKNTSEAQEIIQTYASLLESYVRRYPDHYGFTLFFRKNRANIDPYPFFLDHLAKEN